MKVFVLLFSFATITGCHSQVVSTADGLSDNEAFVALDTVVPTAVFDVRYATSNNFVGRPIACYDSAKVLLTLPTATALKRVSHYLSQRGYVLKIFDGYRPQCAVDDFVQWSTTPDTTGKSEYYPDIPKSELFERGYIAAHSGHSRGSTVDLTLIDAETGQELDMGTPFDYFGPASAFSSGQVNLEQTVNRSILRNAMLAHGFRPYAKEWWHFTLRDEPHPDTYFSFPVR